MKAEIVLTHLEYCMEFDSKGFECQEAEEFQYDVMPEHDAVLLLDLRDVAVNEIDDLLEGSSGMRVVMLTYRLPVD